MNVTGILLAGGKSSRMGTPKALLPVGEELLISKTLQQLRKVTTANLVVTPHPHLFQMLEDVSFCQDAYENAGPLAGIEAGLTHTQTEYAAIVACDMPGISSEFLGNCLKEMETGVDVVMAPREPLQAIYRVSTCLQRARNCLLEKQGSLREFLLGLQVKEIAADQNLFINLNTPEEYKEYLRRFDRGKELGNH